jgi:hypothetical protein
VHAATPAFGGVMRGLRPGAFLIWRSGANSRIHARQRDQGHLSDRYSDLVDVALRCHAR